MIFFRLFPMLCWRTIALGTKFESISQIQMNFTLLYFTCLERRSSDSVLSKLCCEAHLESLWNIESPKKCLKLKALCRCRTKQLNTKIQKILDPIKTIKSHILSHNLLTLFQSYTLPILHSSTLFLSYIHPILHSSNPTLTLLDSYTL